MPHLFDFSPSLFAFNLLELSGTRLLRWNSLFSWGQCFFEQFKEPLHYRFFVLDLTSRPLLGQQQLPRFGESSSPGFVYSELFIGPQGLAFFDRKTKGNARFRLIGVLSPRATAPRSGELKIGRKIALPKFLTSLFVHYFCAMAEKKYKIGIALSGGGARGIAHLGVLKALNERGIEPEIVSGASAGSIVGALYADGHQPEEIFRIFQEQGFYRFVRFGLEPMGILKLDGLVKLLKENLSVERIEDLKKPLRIACTEFNTGKMRFFDEGPLTTLVRASCSIPILFKAVEFEGNYLVDGGVTSNLPVEPIADDCERLIGSHVNPIDEKDDLSGWSTMIDRVFTLATYNTIRPHIPNLDLFIEPLELAHFGIFSTAKDREMFEIGYEETLRRLDEGGFEV